MLPPCIISHTSLPSQTKRNVRLLNDMREGVPPVLGDTGRIIQIFHNLIGNSCKFTHNGSISISALLKARVCVREEGRACLPAAVARGCRTKHCPSCHDCALKSPSQGGRYHL